MARLTRTNGRWTLRASIAAVVVLAGCGSGASNASPTPTPSQTTASTGKDGTLLLRWRLIGGLAGRGGATSLPDFSLYRDGRAIVADEGGGVLPTATEHRLTPAAVTRIEQEAREAGLGRSRHIDKPGIADAFTLVLTYVAGGQTYTTSIVHPEGQSDRAAGFWHRLDPKTWSKSDLAADPKPYRMTRLAVLSVEIGTSGGSGQPTAGWPLGRLGTGPKVGPTRCLVLSGTDLGAAERVIKTAKPGTRWSSGGHYYSLFFRPMLPDETDCSTLVE